MLTPISPESWIPSDGIILEPNAEAAVRSNFNTVVVAGPGATRYGLAVPDLSGGGPAGLAGRGGLLPGAG